MDGSVEISAARCRECGSIMDAHTATPCLACGQLGTKLVDIRSTATVRVSARVFWEQRREFLETNKKLRFVLNVITFLSPPVGLIVQGSWGFVVGMVLAVVSYVLGPYAVMKVREIRYGGGE
jgi:hypothetical protein